MGALYRALKILGQIATDRLWNINEDSGFAVQLAAVVSSAVKSALKGDD